MRLSPPLKGTCLPAARSSVSATSAARRGKGKDVFCSTELGCLCPVEGGYIGW